ncbi:hypothetical protein D2T31_02705 [Sinirhodobacter populi]|uniref:Peptidase S9 prolyl oligopeptidase catalytic domain-containing protein n=1 Tax=Paenirhodobacter populi TaxID=2306993 RepID=A0A443KGL1_9RHOB|nr:hypothetical protein [Sinirhodobacter populi]RWR31894.1 hypothetical protein D2T31_02705 [Sinirhodobacter populi]
MARHSVPREHWPPVDEMFDRARANPNSPEVWAGSSLRFWADAIDRRILESLLAAETEFLLIQGGRDTATPPELARMVADRFAADGRCNLTYWEFPGLDHGLGDTEGISGMAGILRQAAVWAQAKSRAGAPSSCRKP